MSNKSSKEFPETDNLLELNDNNFIKNSINYDSPDDVANLMAKHLAKIFVSTYRKSMAKTIDILNGTCK